MSEIPLEIDLPYLLIWLCWIISILFVSAFSYLKGRRDEATKACEFLDGLDAKRIQNYHSEYTEEVRRG